MTRPIKNQETFAPGNDARNDPLYCAATPAGIVPPWSNSTRFAE
jgi:hypothetical protein